MHLRPDHAVTDLPTLHAFIRQHPLGVLTTSLPSDNFPTLQCSHIPWVLDEPADSGTGNGTGKYTGNDKGRLRGHIARANPHTKALIKAVTEAESAGGSTDPNSARQGEGGGVPVPVRAPAEAPAPAGTGLKQVLPGEVLIIFTSPVDHYITPQFYTASVGSKKVAPTWNYAAVQVYGRMVVHHAGESAGTFLSTQLGDLARLGEVGVMGYTNTKGEPEGEGGHGDGSGRSPWRIADAPVEYISMLKKGIVGMEVEMTRIEGRFKGSQGSI